MTGESSDLGFIADLCEAHKAFLVIDDAHGTGVLGRGKGSAEHFGINSKLKLTMGTFSKSFAVTGGFLAGDAASINFIRFFARPYFFSAAISPMIASAVLAGLEILNTQPERVQLLHERANLLRRLLKEANIQHRQTESAIIPVYPPQTGIFRQLALELHNEGLFINPIEPPAVPVGEERFRMSVMATHSEGDIYEAVEILKRVFRRYTP
jgi:glycine C-acetyltransferase